MTASVWEPGETITPMLNAAGTLQSEVIASADGKTVFNLTKFVYTVNTGALLVFINGVIQIPGVDFTETSTSSFTMTSSLLAEDVVLAIGFVGIATNAGTTLAVVLASSAGASLIGTAGGITVEAALALKVSSTDLTTLLTSYVTTAALTAAGYVTATASTPRISQCMLSAPVDNSGFTSLGGVTGSTIVTAAGTIKATVTNGSADYTGSITNPSWTGLNVAGIIYLGLAITSAGAVTAISTKLLPVYQWGGVASTTNGQYTYNIQERKMYLGNGTTATQVFVVFIGEVLVSGGLVVSTITWYALMGRAYLEQTGLTAGGTYTLSHNVGCKFLKISLWLECLNAITPYAVGDTIGIIFNGDAGTGPHAYGTGWDLTSTVLKIQTLVTGIGTNAATAGGLSGTDWKACALVERAFT